MTPSNPVQDRIDAILTELLDMPGDDTCPTGITWVSRMADYMADHHGWARPTTHRIVRTMLAEGLLERIERTGRLVGTHVKPLRISVAGRKRIYEVKCSTAAVEGTDTNGDATTR